MDQVPVAVWTVDGIRGESICVQVITVFLFYKSSFSLWDSVEF